ncbi:MAG: polysaccharide biosynthesis/export family protein [Phycisphaeraceae bacterium]
MSTNTQSGSAATAAVGCCLATLLALAGLVLVGCAGQPHYGDLDAFVREPRPIVTATEYRLAPPDVIRFRSREVGEVDGHTEIVRPDGYVTLPLLGSVFVAGRTCEEVADELEGLAQEYYEHATVSVHVARYASKKIYVFGEVAMAGAYPYDGANTVLETLANAQPTRLANPAAIHVLRPGQEGEEPARLTIDLDKMIQRGETDLDVVLEEGDIVFVPPNGLASVGLALNQLLLPIQPATRVVHGPGDIESDVAGTRYGRSGDYR